MVNNHTKYYWRGFRRAKIHVFLAGLERLTQIMDETDSIDEMDSIGEMDEVMVYNKGYIAGIEACKKELSKLIRKDGDYEFN